MTVAERDLTTAPVEATGQQSIPGVVRTWVTAPVLAIQFLTVLPPLVRRAPCAQELGRSETFFPLVGLLLGGLLAGTDLLVAGVVQPLVRDVLLVALLAALTGALHLDGVIDTFDGLFGGYDRERRLAIMRDPRAGSFGVVAVVLILALKVAALSSLPDSLRMSALLLAPCLGRWSIVLSTGAFPYARSEGMGLAFKHSVLPRHVAGAGLWALGAGWLLLGPGGLAVWVGATLGALLAGRWIAARLGGLTGDSYGALCELTEAAVLVGLGLRIGGLSG